MSKQDSLFLLIKSLSAGEKAFVRSADKSQSAYIALFDLIARQRSYDERKLKKKFQGQHPKVNYSYARNYLTRHILKCLREHRDAPGTGLARQVLEIDILMERKVHALAEKILAKTRKKALEEERWEAFLHLTQQELTLLLQDDAPVEQSIQAIRAVNAERKRAREKLANLGAYEDLYFAYRPIAKRKQSARNVLDLDLIAELRQHDLLADANAAISARALRMLHRCCNLVYSFAGEYDKTKEWLGKAIDHYRAFPWLMEDHPIDYVNDLLRYGAVMLYFKDFEAVEKSLAEIKEFQDAHAIHGSEMFDKYYRLLVGYAMESKSYDLAAAHMEAISKGIAAYKDSLPWTSVSIILFMLARLAFEQAQYEDARAWLNEILDAPSRGIREDITSLSRILMIFIYYETGEYDLVESYSRATRKYLRRREGLHKFEACILRFLEGNSFHATTRSEIEALKQLRTDLEAIFKDRFEASILNYFDMLGWLDAKIVRLES